MSGGIEMWGSLECPPPSDGGERWFKSSHLDFKRRAGLTAHGPARRNERRPAAPTGRAAPLKPERVWVRLPRRAQEGNGLEAQIVEQPVVNREGAGASPVRAAVTDPWCSTAACPVPTGRVRVQILADLLGRRRGTQTRQSGQAQTLATLWVRLPPASLTCVGTGTGEPKRL